MAAEYIPLGPRTLAGASTSRVDAPEPWRDTSQHAPTLYALEDTGRATGYQRRVSHTSSGTDTSTDLGELYKERAHSRVAWTKSPFHPPENVEEAIEALENDRESRADFVQRHSSQRSGTLPRLHINVADNVPWIDLLLEIAMATAFASLADNTPILSGLDVFSFVAFFGLVWWVWASQVAYNVRFRQADWFHRLCAFFQLAVFSGMAAFTNQFDVSGGLFHAPDEQEAENRQIQLNTDSVSVLQAQRWRSRRLPTLNARGISIVMFLSRLLMFLQYLLVFIYAKHYRRNAIIWHMGSIALSAGLYFAAYLVLGSNPSGAEHAVKFTCWYLGILLELVAHFIANRSPGRANYSPGSVRDRCAILFIIVLGTGLDKITNSFRYVVGTLGFGAQSVAVLFSVAVIVIGLFGSYFGVIGGLPRPGQMTNRRILTWFFLHFPFLAAMIVVLQGVVIILAFTNLKTVTQRLIITLADVMKTVLKDGPAGKNATSEFPDADKILRKLGVSLDHVLGSLPPIKPEPGQDIQLNSTANATFAQAFFEVFLVSFGQLNALPESGSLLQVEVDEFMRKENIDYLKVNLNGMATLVRELLTERIRPIEWFMGACGGTMIMLAILMIARQNPRDKWEWCGFFTWMISGTFFALLSLFNINAKGIRLYWDQQKVIYHLSSWILSIFGAVLIITNLIFVGFEILAMKEAERRRTATTPPEFDYATALLHSPPAGSQEPFDPWTAARTEFNQRDNQRREQ